MKRSILALAIISAASLPLGLQAEEKKSAAPEAAVRTEYNTITAKVLEVDHANQTLTLQQDDGSTVKLTVDAKVKNFKNIKKGDLVKVEKMESLALSLIKKEKGEKPSAEVVTEAQTAPVGSKPSAEVVKARQITAEVVKVDVSKSLLELKGPAGNILAIKARDPKNLEGIKKGDMIAATYTEAVAVSVEPMPAK
ncbi:MAG TPA: hypothetical protein VFW62_01945 [bacterium]|nr:hypothetical protein [bacterium]